MAEIERVVQILPWENLEISENQYPPGGFQLLYRGNSKLRGLLMMCCFIIMISFLVGIILNMLGNFSKKYDVCGTEKCNNISKTINNMLSYDIDPCTDFSEFVCAKFWNQSKIPEDKVEVAPYILLDDQLQNQLRNILEEEISENDIEPFKLMKKIYRTCNDIDTLNKLELSPLFSLSEDFEEWPITSGDLKEYDWKTQLLNYRSLAQSEPWITGLFITLDLKNTSRKILQIEEPELSIPKEFFIEGFTNKFVHAYYGFMKNVSKIIDNSTNKDEALKDIIKFQIKIAKVMLGKQINPVKMYNKQTLGEIDEEKYEMFEPIGFFNYVNAYFIDKNDDKLSKLVRFNRNETINNMVPKYLIYINDILKNTPKRTIKNYLTWKFMESKLQFLTEDIRNLILYYNFYTSGLSKRQPRWKECVIETKKMVPHAVAAAYVRYCFNKKSKIIIESMLHTIKIEMQKIIRSVEWMDEETKKFALIKLDKIKYMVGYPKELMNDSLIIDEYKDYQEHWTNNKFFISSIRLQHLDEFNLMKKFRELIDKNDWRIFADVVVINAFYSPLVNTIVLPAAILQGVYFDIDTPTPINYGTIGTIIGHEIIHAFDNFGSQFDGDGNLRNWWSPRTKNIFELKYRNLMDQYSNFKEPITQLNVDGYFTLNENIADNGAVIIAYNALVSSGKENEVLKVLNFTGKQLFWLSYAKTECIVSTKEVLLKNMISNRHSPGRFRINGPLQNNIDFSKDFQCKNESYMAPETKNIVWG